MNKLHLAGFAALIFLVGSMSAFAQTTAAPKIGFINSAQFYDPQSGITRLVGANKQLETEFTAKAKELKDGTAQLQAIAKELDSMRKLPQAQFNQTAYSAKQDEGERLQRELGYKKSDLEAAIKARREVLVSPISRDIGNGITEFAKKNGYGVILDPSKLDDVGALLFFAQGAEVTSDFIAFYNARPVPTTAPAAPAAKPN